MNLGGHDIGICSWSLRPESTSALLDSVRALGLSHMQIALAPLLDMLPEERAPELELLKTSGIALTASMIGFEGENYSSIASIRKTGGFVPSDRWPARRDRALAAGQLSAELGVSLITAHPGFVPPSADPSYGGIINRITEIANLYAEIGVTLCLETGQERAPVLLQFLNDLNMKNVGINFDPANMLLYGAGDPIEAIEILARHIRHVHVKDAQGSAQPGIEWGTEVPFGKGELKVHGFLRALADAGYTGPLVIEREAGATRDADVLQAIDTLEAHLVV